MRKISQMSQWGSSVEKGREKEKEKIEEREREIKLEKKWIFEGG